MRYRDFYRTVKMKEHNARDNAHRASVDSSSPVDINCRWIRQSKKYYPDESLQHAAIIIVN